MDISFELLQRAVSHITELSWLQEKTKIKSIHGDFTQLLNYKKVYQYDDTLNIFCLLGFTFGNYKEAELLGKIREGMLTGDYLLFDVRLHKLGPLQKNVNKLSQAEKAALGINYHHSLNNKFAFGGLESVSNLDFDEVQNDFCVDVCRKYTSVSNSVNIVTTLKIPKGKKIILRKKSKKLDSKMVNLAFTTLYDYNSLIAWFDDQEMDVIWEKESAAKAIFLVRKR